jgi:hypothetical protein
MLLDTRSQETQKLAITQSQPSRKKQPGFATQSSESDRSAALQRNDAMGQ